MRYPEGEGPADYLCEQCGQRVDLANCTCADDVVVVDVGQVIAELNLHPDTIIGAMHSPRYEGTQPFNGGVPTWRHP